MVTPDEGTVSFGPDTRWVALAGAQAPFELRILRLEDPDTWNSFGVVAHSQGGAASMHLYTYYWSGHVTGQCHTAGMRYPALYLNASRIRR